VTYVCIQHGEDQLRDDSDLYPVSSDSKLFDASTHGIRRGI
jgi:hypothetical protein